MCLGGGCAANQAFSSSTSRVASSRNPGAATRGRVTREVVGGFSGGCLMFEAHRSVASISFGSALRMSRWCRPKSSRELSLSSSAMLVNCSSKSWVSCSRPGCAGCREEILDRLVTRVEQFDEDEDAVAGDVGGVAKLLHLAFRESESSCHPSRPSPFGARAPARRTVVPPFTGTSAHRGMLPDCSGPSPQWLRGTTGLHATLGRASGAVPLPNQSRSFDLSSSELDWPRGRVMVIQNRLLVKPRSGRAGISGDYGTTRPQGSRRGVEFPRDSPGLNFHAARWRRCGSRLPTCPMKASNRARYPSRNSRVVSSVTSWFALMRPGFETK